MRRAVLHLLLMAAFSHVLACATEGGDDGGDKNLPDRGIAGWSSTGTAEAPFVLSPGRDAAEVWGGPAAVVVADDVVLYYHVTTAESSVIRRVVSPDGRVFGAPPDATDALADAHDPSVAACGPDCFIMAFVGVDGALGIAESDDGITFERAPATGLPLGTEPSLVVDGERVLLYAVTSDGVVMAEAERHLEFGVATLVFGPGADCIDAFGKSKPCWDEGGVAGPDVRLATTAAGRRVFRMFFASGRADEPDLGFAASFDGVVWSRYAFSPVVAERFGQAAPSAVVAPHDRGYLLYWAEQRSETYGGIVLARSPAAHASETW